MRDECLALHRLWSFSLAGSDVWRINEPTARVKVDSRTARLLLSMKEFHNAEPAFDFTVGPVSFLWKHAESVPPEAQIAEALAHVGADKVSIEGDEVVKADPLTQVDVGGAAKGFAADIVAAKLRAAGVASADIDLGGNLYMLGNHPANRGAWRYAFPKGSTSSVPSLKCATNPLSRAAVTSDSSRSTACATST